MPAEFTDMIISLWLLAVFGVLTWYTASKGYEKITDAVAGKKSLYIHLLKLVSGICLFGVIPVSFLAPIHQYLRFPEFSFSSLLVFLLISLVVAGVSYVAARNITFSFHPVTAAKQAMVFYFLLRILFLVAYEFFFRGTFLPLLLLFFPKLVSVLINTLLYALVHAGSGKKEWIGSIPFGIILCMLTVETGSVWPAVWLHLLLAMIYEPLVLNKIFVTNKPVTA